MIKLILSYLPVGLTAPPILPTFPPGKVTLIELSVGGCVRRCQLCMLPDVGQAAGWELPFLGLFLG